MSTATKVLVLLEQVRPTGLVRQLIELLGRLPAHGIRPRLVCIVRHTEHLEPLEREMSARGIDFQAVAEAHALDLRPLRQVRRLIEEWQPDILESHGYKSVAYARALKLVEPTLPWIAYYHGRTATDWKVRLYHLFERWAVGAATAIAPVAEGVEDHFRQRDRPRLTPVPNAIIEIRRTGREGSSIRTAIGVEQESPLIGFVGRFSHEKAPDRFVEVFAELAKNQPSLRGIMLGEGPLLGDVERSLEDRGLDQRVHLAGRVNEIGNYYGAMNALLIPSRSEVFPNVLLEAVCAHLPVAAMPVGGIPSVAKSLKTVFVAEGMDLAALTRAAERALDCRDPVWLADSRRRLEAEYSLDHRAELAAELYRNVLERTS